MNLSAQMEALLARQGARTPPPRKPAPGAESEFGHINHAAPPHDVTPETLPMADVMRYEGENAIRAAFHHGRHFASYDHSGVESAKINYVKGPK